MNMKSLETRQILHSSRFLYRSSFGVNNSVILGDVHQTENEKVFLEEDDVILNQTSGLQLFNSLREAN